MEVFSWPNLRHFNAPGFDFAPCELQLSTTVLLKPRQPEHERNFMGKRDLVSLLGYFTLALAAGPSGPAGLLSFLPAKATTSPKINNGSTGIYPRNHPLTLTNRLYSKHLKVP